MQGNGLPHNVIVFSRDREFYGDYLFLLPYIFTIFARRQNKSETIFTYLMTFPKKIKFLAKLISNWFFSLKRSIYYLLHLTRLFTVGLYFLVFSIVERVE